MTQLLMEDLSQVGQLLYSQVESNVWTDLLVVEPIK